MRAYGTCCNVAHSDSQGRSHNSEITTISEFSGVGVESSVEFTSGGIREYRYSLHFVRYRSRATPYGSGVAVEQLNPLHALNISFSMYVHVLLLYIARTLLHCTELFTS